MLVLLDADAAHLFSDVRSADFRHAGESNDQATWSRLIATSHTQDGLTIADIRAKAMRSLERFQRATMQRIAVTGISLPPAIEFTGTEEGNMVVGGRHPEADLIDAEICCDIQLAQYFKEVEVEFELLRALECEAHGTARQMDERFHLGLTSTGPVVYFGR